MCFYQTCGTQLYRYAFAYMKVNYNYIYLILTLPVLYLTATIYNNYFAIMKDPNHYCIYIIMCNYEISNLK